MKVKCKKNVLYDGSRYVVGQVIDVKDDALIKGGFAVAVESAAAPAKPTTETKKQSKK